MTLYMSKYQGLEMHLHLDPFHANLFHAIQRGGGAAGVAVHVAGGGCINSFCT